MRRALLAMVLVLGAATGFAQAQERQSGPAYSKRFFTTALDKDPSREVQMQMQLHLPNRLGNPFHSHNGDQWQYKDEMAHAVEQHGLDDYGIRDREDNPDAEDEARERLLPAQAEFTSTKRDHRCNGNTK